MIKPACQLHPLDTACTITAAGDTPQKERASPALLSQHVGTCDTHSCSYLAKVVPISCQFPTESQQYHKDSFLHSSAGVQSALQTVSSTGVFRLPPGGSSEFVSSLGAFLVRFTDIQTTSQWASVLW